MRTREHIKYVNGSNVDGRFCRPGKRGPLKKFMICQIVLNGLIFFLDYICYHSRKCRKDVESLEGNYAGAKKNTSHSRVMWNYMCEFFKGVIEE